MDIRTEKLLQYDTWYGEWTAVDVDTYDGLHDGNNIVGFGDTEQEAIEDLKEKLFELGYL